jgi:hypothetical protein
MADNENSDNEEGAFISVIQAIKLIPRPFEGNPKQLREFIEGVEAAIGVVHPNKQELLLKFIVAKIQGDAKDKLLARVERNNWRQIKGILEENYLVKRTLEYHTSLLFSSKQGSSETVAQWGARLDHLAMDLRTEARHRLLALEVKDNAQYVEGGLKLIGEFLKGTFISGLKDERIRVIVKARGEDDSLAQIIETAIQEESELKSQRHRNPQQNSQWYPRNFPVKQERIGRSHPGGSQEPSIKREVMATSALKNCYNCLKPGHIARNCNNISQCPKCGKNGHVKAQCYQGNRPRGGSGNRGSPAVKETVQEW